VWPYARLLHPEALAAELGLTRLRFVAAADRGGAGPVSAVQSAAWALRSGTARCVLVPCALNGYSETRASTRAQPGAKPRGVTALSVIGDAYLMPNGLFAPAQNYALMANRHRALHGISELAAAEVALACRQHAQANPRALMRGRPLDLDEYRASPMIATPFRRLDCSLETDGACALVVTMADRARDLRQPAVRILATAEGYPVPADDFCGRADILDTGLAQAARRAFGISGLAAADIDVALVYDCFTYVVLLQLEAMGFCPPGGIEDFVADGAIRHGGRLPVNTHGGLLAEAHVGGMNHFTEAVRQLRRQADLQVADCAAALVTGWGQLGDTGLAILGR
jgi:acetyl-CoA acetyltransferase